MYTYIYIYTYVYMYIYIYTHVYILYIHIPVFCIYCVGTPPSSLAIRTVFYPIVMLVTSFWVWRAEVWITKKTDQSKFDPVSKIRSMIFHRSGAYCCCRVYIPRTALWMLHTRQVDFCLLVNRIVAFLFLQSDSAMVHIQTGFSIKHIHFILMLSHHSCCDNLSSY